LASRLSENPNVTVLLLEAGINDREAPLTKVPIMSYFLRDTNIDWQYKAERQSGACLGMAEQVNIPYISVNHINLSNTSISIKFM
jgi:choline dehydrogenase-like flavoprotein